MIAFNDIVGIVGVSLVLGGYFFLQIGRLSQNNPWYSIMNGLGALLILYSLWFDFNLPSVVIELAWLTISIIGLVHTLKTRRTRGKGNPADERNRQ